MAPADPGPLRAGHTQAGSKDHAHTARIGPLSHAQTPDGAPGPIASWYYRRGVQPPGWPPKPALYGFPAAAWSSSSLRHWIPGFRSGSWWKVAIACVFYAACLLLGLSGILTARWAAAGFSMSLLATGVLVVFMISYWRIRLANVAIVAALLIAVGGCGLSLANLPSRPPASGRTSPSTPEPAPMTTAVQIAETTPAPVATAPPMPTPAAVLRPTTAPIPPPSPPPAKDLCGAPTNPWGYNLCGGSTIFRPPSAFCQYFGCIGNIWKGGGYVIECGDGMYSTSGGTPGCSHHGGDLRPLYQ